MRSPTSMLVGGLVVCTALASVLACGRGAEVHDRPVPGGNAERGAMLLAEYGCGACHMIPGVAGADGLVGPPLTRWAERGYIAGAVPNTAEWLIVWLVDPQAIEPGTVMPNLGVTPEQARDMTAYLYTLGDWPPTPLPHLPRPSWLHE